MSLRKALKVMVVDDMSVSQGLLTQALEEIGIWNVRTDTSGQGALTKLLADPAHLVISDYNMPGMDGLQLLEAVRRNRSTARTGFILVTGTPTQKIVDAGKKLGLNNLIMKPFTPQSLQGAIEAVVGKLS